MTKSKTEQNEDSSVNYMTDQYVDRLKTLTSAIEQGDIEQSDILIAELTTMRESSLFQELGKLTREIHDSINSFSQDDRIAELAEDEIPDAKERLNYIITKTDEAAHRTMTGVEDVMEIVGNFSADATRYQQLWNQFRNRELTKQDFVNLSSDLDVFFDSIESATNNINSKMTDVMMAQDYQDITGQMIKQVISMVQEIEEKLVHLVALSGPTKLASEPKEKKADGEKAQGPQLPTTTDDVAKSQGDVDDLLASLGF